MVCVICGSSVTDEGARVLHGKAVCPECVTELSAEGTAGTVGLKGGQREGRAEDGGGLGECEEGREASVLPELSAELARLKVGEEDLGPRDCIVACRHGTLFRLSDGSSSVVASGETLLGRLRLLPDGAGEQATWWVLADL